MSATIDVTPVPEDGIVAATVGGRLTCDVAKRTVFEMAEISARHQTDLLLVDLREAKVEASTTDIFELPSHLAGVGLTRRHQVALAVAQDKRDYDFLELVSANRGYSIKVFEDLDKAKSWLTGSS